eukprot:5307536-Pyramimonas_sp.AAC.1
MSNTLWTSARRVRSETSAAPSSSGIGGMLGSMLTTPPCRRSRSGAAGGSAAAATAITFRPRPGRRQRTNGTKFSSTSTSHGTPDGEMKGGFSA